MRRTAISVRVNAGSQPLYRTWSQTTDFSVVINTRANRHMLSESDAWGILPCLVADNNAVVEQ